MLNALSHDCFPPPPPPPQEEDGERGSGGGGDSDDGYYSNDTDEEVKHSTRLAHTRGLKTNAADRIRDKKMLTVSERAWAHSLCSASVSIVCLCVRGQGAFHFLDANALGTTSSFHASTRADGRFASRACRS